MKYVLETSYHTRNIKSGQELFKKKKIQELQALLS